MTNNANVVLKRIQKINFRDWETTLWLVKRRLSGKEAVYNVLRVDTDKKLNRKLKAAVKGRITGKKIVLEEYSFLTADQDNRIFILDSSETDFVRIEEEIKKGVANPKATKYEELLNSWAMVIELKRGNQAVYGMRKINALTQAKKVYTLSSFLFQNSLLVDLSDEEVFTIDLNIDVFVADGVAFITRKKDFESALNFRKGMEENRDEVLEEFDRLEVFSDVAPLREYIGVNLHHLRKISAIKRSAYYQDQSFMQNLAQVNNDENWGLVIADGKIVVTADSAELVLTLLSNSRLKSPINLEVFDAVVKKKVS